MGALSRMNCQQFGWMVWFLKNRFFERIYSSEKQWRRGLNAKEWNSTIWRAILGTTLFRVVFHSLRFKFESFWVIFHSVLEWNHESGPLHAIKATNPQSTTKTQLFANFQGHNSIDFFFFFQLSDFVDVLIKLNSIVDNQNKNNCAVCVLQNAICSAFKEIKTDLIYVGMGYVLYILRFFFSLYNVRPDPLFCQHFHFTIYCM